MGLGAGPRQCELGRLGRFGGKLRRYDGLTTAVGVDLEYPGFRFDPLPEMLGPEYFVSNPFASAPDTRRE